MLSLTCTMLLPRITCGHIHAIEKIMEEEHTTVKFCGRSGMEKQGNKYISLHIKLRAKTDHSYNKVTKQQNNTAKKESKNKTVKDLLLHLDSFANADNIPCASINLSSLNLLESAQHWKIIMYYVYLCVFYITVTLQLGQILPKSVRQQLNSLKSDKYLLEL